jgi:hypothetical protein
MKAAWVTAVGMVAVAAVVAVAMAQPSPAPAAPAIEPAFFNHKIHAGMENAPVIMDPGKNNCATCHKVDAGGKIEIPGAAGHAPCLSSGCHDTWFIQSGLPKDPNYTRAVAFCLGCHETTDGGAPSPWLRHRPVFRSFKAEVEWHVEMPGPDDPVTKGRGSHFAHVDEKDPRQDCRSCHIVTAATGLLEAGTPGHPQCGVSHNAAQRDSDAKNAAVPADKKIQITMSDCGGCHHDGPRVSAPATTGRQDDGIKKDPEHVTTVRSCDGEGADALAKTVKKPAKTVSCFRHDRAQHRFLDFDKPNPSQEVQCGKCHYMIGNQAEWAGLRTKSGKPAKYFTLDDIRDNPIISNDKNREHKSCGSEEGQCHGPAFKANQCEKCHENMSAF